MRFFNPKKIEFLIKNFFGFSDAFLLKRRANRYLRKNTEREIRVLEKLVDPNKASIDIGVYRGVYSYYLTNLTKFVYAFERIFNAFEYRTTASKFALAMRNKDKNPSLVVAHEFKKSNFNDANLDNLKQLLEGSGGIIEHKGVDPITAYYGANFFLCA